MNKIAIASDTTALIVLAKADKLELLTNLFSEILIPFSVRDELHAKDDIVKYRIDKFEILEPKHLQNQSILQKIEKYNLDLGETEAISLAIELGLKLIIDEKKGRKVALKESVKIVGILGILIENYRQKFIDYKILQYCFNLFKDNGLRISQDLEKIFFEKMKQL